jgi:hypothetical protein
MTTSSKAKSASASNYYKYATSYDKKHNAEVRSVIAKYKDRGTSGEKQMLKELAALESKYNKDLRNRVEKGKQDDDNVIKYGKDAMKGKSFAKYNKGGMAKKKMGYNKGGLCGASNPAERPMKKGK